MSKSTHRVEVVPVVLSPHPNASRLSVVNIYGYQCVTNTEQWQGVKYAAYLPPDSVVDTKRPEFEFLAPNAKSDGKVRIKAKKLRGVLSFGLLVPAPEGSVEGEDVAERLGVTHYDPPATGAGNNSNRGGIQLGGETVAGPNVYTVKYDLEAGRRYAEKTFKPGESVWITEKIHGANGRFVFSGGQMYCGSRTEWKREYPDYSTVTVESLEGKGVERERAVEIVERLKSKPLVKNSWWLALDRTPTLRAFCERNPDWVVYGEVYGAVQDLNYGHAKGEVSFAAFDLMRDGKWVDAEESWSQLAYWEVPTVPLVEGGTIPYDFDRVCELAEGPSLVPGADHVREGVVVKTLVERRNEYGDRACLKWVGAGYLERTK